MAIDRSKMRASLSGRADESAKRAESNKSYHSYILDSLPIPTFKKIPEGSIVFDIIPFTVSEDFLVSADTHRPAYNAGEFHYNLDLWVHTGVGPRNWNIVCPRHHLGKPCAICEEADRRKENVEYGDKERFKKEVKPFLPQHRNVYQIWIHDRAKVEENKGVQLLEISFFSLEEKLLAIRKHPETGETIEFAWPGVDGKRITFTRKGTGKDNTQFLGYNFLNRTEEIPDWILEMAVPLNEYIEILEPKQIEEIFLAGQDDDVEEDDQEGNQDKQTHEEERKPRGSRLTSRKTETPEEPRRERRSVPEEETPEEPRRERRGSRRDRLARQNPCPYGYAFGEDVDNKPECGGDCPEDTYNACSAKYDAEHE